MPVVSGSLETNACVLWQSNTPTVTTSGSAAGYAAINLIDPATWSSWRPSAVDGWARYDFGAAVEIDCFGVSGHDLATSAASLELQSSPDGTTWTARVSITPITDDDLLFMLPPLTFRYWRIVVGSNVANISVAVIGKRLAFTHTPVADYKPLHHARQYTKMFNDSIGGQFLGTRVMSVGAETDVNMGFFDRSWLEANIRPFEYHYNQGGCFFFASSPSLYSLDMGYCRAKGENDTLDIQWVEADKMATLEFGIRSYVSG